MIHILSPPLRFPYDTSVYVVLEKPDSLTRDNTFAYTTMMQMQ
jgi:hypothetical protein